MTSPNTTKKLIVLPDELIAAIEAVRAAHGWKSWTYALIWLINAGLASQGYEIIEAAPWGGRRESK